MNKLLNIVFFIIILILSIYIRNPIIIFKLFILYINYLFLISYEREKIVVEKIIIIAVISSIASLGRIIFSSIPGVQPSSFIIIVSSLVFGKSIGSMIGIMTILLSNIILGQGPWTIWQVFVFGSMGYFFGKFNEFFIKRNLICIICGFIWGFVVGYIMNIWFVLSYSDSNKLNGFIVSCIASFYFDFFHGLSNAILLFLGKNKFISTFNRIGIKYGLK